MRYYFCNTTGAAADHRLAVLHRLMIDQAKGFEQRWRYE
jgi:hypothetical protein